MSDLIAGQADLELQRVLRGGEPGSASFAEQPFDRLYRALAELHRGESRMPSRLDLAVLVRHVLRYRSTFEEGDRGAEFVARSGTRWPDQSMWEQVGVDARPTVDGYRILARGWRPDWLTSDVDVDAIAALAPQRRLPDQPVRADPYLARRKWSTFKSRSQRAAIRSALTTPDGAILLTLLPTAEGKSAIFELLAREADGSEIAGTLLVVTPTVALALDLENRARAAGFVGHPRAYHAEEAAGNREIASRIREGTQGLLFSSPEAACGALRSALIAAAAAGRFVALVLDEAHLFDAWGDDFRPEFQLIPALRAELIRHAAPRGFPTILLSATVTQQTLSVLYNSFAPGRSAAFGLGGGLRLRPEIEYWFAPRVDREERVRRVVEALYHLPRPLVVYTTRVDDADSLLLSARQSGFARAASFTGQTRQRDEILREWTTGRLDVIFATSAFGLGVDMPNLRAVVHACIPESIDRFYQETGRAGRDGRAAVAVCIPAQGDAETAEFVSANRSDIGPEKTYSRWEALFLAKQRQLDGTHLVRVDVPPGVDERRIDMQNDRSTFWHKRVLNQLADIGFLELRGLETVAGASEGSFTLGVRVAIREPDHLNRETFETAFRRIRSERAQRRVRDRAAVERLLAAHECVGQILVGAYQLEPIPGVAGLVTPLRPSWACGGCPSCRSLGRLPDADDSGLVRPPWGLPTLVDPCRALSKPNDRLLVFYDDENLGSRLMERAIEDAVDCGTSNVLLWDWPGALPKLRRDTLFVSRRARTPSNESPDLGELPKGPLLILAGPAVVMSPAELRAAADIAPYGPRIYFLSVTTRDPRAPEQELRSRASDSQRSLRAFIEEHRR